MIIVQELGRLMRPRAASLLCLPLLLAPALAWCQSGPVVRFQTNVGNIDVELYQDVAPKTVANFLNYVNKGAYVNTIIHRSVPGFVIQGGGFRVNGNNMDPIPSDPAVENEFNISNSRGTIAMAKQEGNPNSATNQWFFNLKDNAAILDGQNGGFTVFGKITDEAGLAVMDRIASMPVYPSPWADTTPLQNYRPQQVLTPANFILIASIGPLGQARSATDFGAYTAAAVGSYVEIKGSDLAGSTREWEARDFQGNAAPTTVDGVSVTIGGRPAFVSYISPTQINVQVPEGVPTGDSVPVVVTHDGRERTSTTLPIRTLAPGLLANANFRVGDFQFVVAQHKDGRFVANDAIVNIPAAPAVAGETITIYGLGFGPVSQGGVPVAGRVAEGLTSVAAPVEFFFADRRAVVSYAGLAPGLVGLYQFDVAVPAGLGTQDVRLRVTVNGIDIPQTLWIPVRSE